MINDLLNQVSKENLYRHVLHMEGIRHPVFNQAGLLHAIEYLKNELNKSRYEIKEHTFTTDRFSGDFKNIEARNNAEHTTGKPILYISAHYDTHFFSPGANDNASGIAVLLETARIVSTIMENNHSQFDVRFVCFTLEEKFSTNDMHHVYYFWHDRNNAGNYNFYNLLKKIKTMFYGKQPIEETYTNAITLLTKNKPDLERNDYEFLEKTIEQYKTLTAGNEITHNHGLTGSTHFVEEGRKETHTIHGCINLETIGYSSNSDHSQWLPPALHPYTLSVSGILKKYNTKRDLSKGNFICIICDKNSSALGDVFYKQTKNKNIKLPSALFSLPLTYAGIDQKFPDMLRSDHAPFWKYNIPALFITDTANFRYPYYHTEADTIDKLDFDFMEKVCKTVLSTVIKTCL